MMRRLSLLLLTLWTLTVIVIAAPPAELDATLKQLQQDPALRGAKIGIYIQSLLNGDIWYAQRDGEMFIPASTAKVVTAAMALEYLKPDYCFTTSIMTDGPVVDGVLRGNVYLRGGGDPTLTPAVLARLACALRDGTALPGGAPIREIQGRVLLDTSFFPHADRLRGPGWEVEDLPWYFAAPPSTFAVAQNTVRLTVTGASPGQPPTVTLDPPTRELTIHNRASTRAGNHSLTVTPRNGAIYLAGTLAPGASVVERLSVPHADRFAIEQMTLAFRAAGIQMHGAPVVGTPAPHVTLAECYSTRLSEVVASMLKGSDNHIAEQLRLTLLALYSQQVPLAQRYPAMQEDYCAHSGIVSGNFVLVDGSGLSRQNHMNPRGAVRMLVHMARSDQFALFHEGLPIAGVDGTLKTRMVGTPAANNARAKTGTMRGISTLAGYVTTGEGERLAFAIFVNGYSGPSASARALQDRIVSYLAGIAPAAPKADP